jgi:hypothetical protein
MSCDTTDVAHDAAPAGASELVRSMTVHFAVRAIAEQDPALGLIAVILDEATADVAAAVAGILREVETAAVDPLGVVERVARDLLAIGAAR